MVEFVLYSGPVCCGPVCLCCIVDQCVCVVQWTSVFVLYSGPVCCVV